MFLEEILKKGGIIRQRWDCSYSVILHAENQEDEGNDISMVFNTNC